MPNPQRRWLYHTPPGWVGDARYFITLCCQVRGPNQLCAPSVAPKLIAAVQNYHQARRWHVTLWLLMPDHLHAVVSVPRTGNLAKAVAAWKRFTAGDTGVIWQKGFFDHRLRNDASFAEKAAYVRMNPVRKGLVDRPEDWPHVWPIATDR